MWQRVEFFMLAGTFSAASVVLLFVGVADRFGPVTSTSGEVVEVGLVYPGPDCRGLDCLSEDRDEPVHVVRGDRDVGEAWEVRGPEVHDVMRGSEGQQVQITTSRITGRIVALETDRAGWAVRDSTFLVLAFGFPLVWFGSLAVLQWSRRRGKDMIGAISPRQALWLLPGALLGAAGTLWALTGQSG